MDIFELVKNESFFSLLVGRNRKIYYDCLTEIMRMKNEKPVLYDAEIRCRIDLYLRNNKINFLRDETNADSADPAAAYIIKRMRDCGWLTEKQMKGLSYTTNLTPAAMRILGAFMRICEQQSSQKMSNRFLSMHRLIRSAMMPGSDEVVEPYSLIIEPLHENVQELELELTDLRDSVSIIMKSLIQVESMNELGIFLSKDKLLKKFFRDYFFLKNSGLIPAKIGDITRGIRWFRYGENGLFEKAKAELAEKDDITLQAAEERIDSEIDVINYFLETAYDEDIRAIEKKINTYYNLAHLRLMVMMSNGENTRTKLDHLMHAQKSMMPEKRQILFEKLSACIQVTNTEYIGTKSFEHRNRSKSGKLTSGIPIVEISEEEKQKKTAELMMRSSSKYTPQKLREYFEHVAFKHGGFETGDIPVQSRTDALMYAAAIVHARSEDFPYKVELEESIYKTKYTLKTDTEQEATEAVEMSRIHLTKGKKA